MTYIYTSTHANKKVVKRRGRRLITSIGLFFKGSDPTLSDNTGGSLVPRPSRPHANIHDKRIIIYPPKSGKVWSILYCNDDVTLTWFGLTWSWFGLPGYRALPAHTYALARTLRTADSTNIGTVRANVNQTVFLHR